MTETQNARPAAQGEMQRSPHRLRRSPSQGLIAGVAAGLAGHYGINPIIVRAAAVVLGMLGGIGVLVYIVLWAAMAPDGTRSRPWSTRVVALVGYALGAIALSMVFDFRIGFLGAGLVLPVILVAVAAWLVLKDDDHTPPRMPPSPPKQSTEPVTAPREHSGTHDSATDLGSAAPGRADTADIEDRLDLETPVDMAWQRPAPARPALTDSAQTERLPGSRLGLIVLGALLLVYSALAAADLAGVFAVPWAPTLAGSLLGVGAIAIVAAFFVRARALIIVAALLALAAGAARAWAIDVGTLGERRIDPATVADLDDAYSLSVGRLDLDLRELEFGRDRTELAADVGFGEIHVLVPDDVGVVVDASVGAGSLDVLGVERDGLGLDEVVRADPRARDNTGSVVLDLDVGAGEISVDRSR